MVKNIELASEIYGEERERSNLKTSLKKHCVLLLQGSVKRPRTYPTSRIKRLIGAKTISLRMQERIVGHTTSILVAL